MPLPTLAVLRQPSSTLATSIFAAPSTPSSSYRARRSRQVVRMAPEEEKMTHRSSLDFPIEWEKPKPIFPQSSPTKTTMPPPLPADPPKEDEEEEEKKDEVEEDPKKERSLLKNQKNNEKHRGLR